MLTVAFQGEMGAFSHEAATKLLGEIEAVPCRTFEDVFAVLANGRVRCALVPIENSLAGSVVRNYELMAENETLSIHGEVFLRISHNLIVPPGVRLSDVTHVYSHPVALAQCQRFIAERGLEAVAAYDTAGAVMQV